MQSLVRHAPLGPARLARDNPVYPTVITPAAPGFTHQTALIAEPARQPRAFLEMGAYLSADEALKLPDLG